LGASTRRWIARGDQTVGRQVGQRSASGSGASSVHPARLAWPMHTVACTAAAGSTSVGEHTRWTRPPPRYSRRRRWRRCGIRCKHGIAAARLIGPGWSSGHNRGWGHAPPVRPTEDGAMRAWRRGQPRRHATEQLGVARSPVSRPRDTVGHGSEH
jgi:hypothetical protein